MRFLKRLRPTNRGVRVLVGLLLAALFCVQCTTESEALRTGGGVRPVDGKALGKLDADMLAKVRRLAKTDHVALLEYCLRHYEGRYADYSCTFVKQERIGGTLQEPQAIDVKFMESPYSVAMKWVENAPTADRAIYVEGKWNNQVLFRLSNVALRAMMPSVLRKPEDPQVMKNTLRPISKFGFRRAMHSLLDTYRQAKDAGDLGESFGGLKQVNGRNCAELIRTLPAKGDYPAHITRTYIDLEYLVPIRIEGDGWDGQLHSRYEYKNVRFNVGLTQEDFLPKSNDVAAPR
ncbi:MAG: DUF1571 domain-containing protein [Phycisphaerae bacterium]|nr:DUF1571 domain-containing protein [Phycisphaerae bacterium]